MSLVRNIYTGLIYPTLIHNVILWGGVWEFYKQKVRELMNKVLQNVFQVRNNSNNIPMVSLSYSYVQLSLLKFDDIYEFFLSKFVHFVMYKRPQLWR